MASHTLMATKIRPFTWGGTWDDRYLAGFGTEFNANSG